MEVALRSSRTRTTVPNNNQADCVSDLFGQSFACNHAYYLAFKAEDRNAVNQKGTQG